MVALQLIVTSWSSLWPIASFFMIFLIPLFSIQVIHQTQLKGWFIYFISITLTQVFILPIPWDWFLLFMFPSMMMGLYIGLASRFFLEESIVFVGGSLLQMALLWGVNALSDVLYSINYTSLIEAIFSLSLVDHLNLLYLGLYSVSLLQFLLTWVVSSSVLNMHKPINVKLYSAHFPFLLLILLLIMYVGFYVVLDFPFLWLIGPLLFLSVNTIVHSWIWLSKSWKRILVFIGLLYPLFHALIATYSTRWAFPLSLLMVPFVVILIRLTSRSTTSSKIG